MYLSFAKMLKNMLKFAPKQHELWLLIFHDGQQKYVFTFLKLTCCGLFSSLVAVEETPENGRKME